MARTYSKGLHEIGNGLFAYLQPEGQWGYSNAGLVLGEDSGLLVDTLFDLKLTQQMLDAMARVRGQRPIETVINTHANGDHCWGNQLVTGAEIIASRRCAEELADIPPSMLRTLLQHADQLGAVGAYLKRIFGAFDFEGITLTPPTRTFDGELSLRVGSRELRLIEVGPAHTAGDVLVYLPAERVVFTGDIVFAGGTPIVWAGPISNWIAACDRILELEVATVVPGHGPISDASAVRDMRAYLGYVDAEAAQRHAAGMSLDDAVHDIAFGAFSGWLDRERLAVNVQAKYRELSPTAPRANTAELFSLMAKLV
jgi:glyoxylase-like metal-dependent hydrolase (beta-lactamase superfamily II)